MAIHENFLILDKGALRHDNVEISLDNRFTRQAGSSGEFCFSKETPVFLTVEFSFPGLNVDNTFATFPLPAADNIHIQPGTLGCIEDGGAPLHLNLTVTRKERYCSHSHNSCH